jgi:hypothetical protein
MHRLLDNPHMKIDIDPSRGFVRMTRTEVGFDSADTIQSFVERIDEVMRHLDRAKLRLLVDLRRAPMRTGDAFDPELRRAQKTTEGFARCAVLVQTAVGRLQVNRISRETGVDHGVFNDEKEALAFLG